MRKHLFIVAFVSLLLVSCLFQASKPAGVTDEEWNLMVFQSAYNAQFRDATSMSKNPNITPAQEQIVRKKVEVLQQIKPILDVYALAVNSGRPVDKTQEQKIYDLLTSIGSTVERRATK